MLRIATRGILRAPAFSRALSCAHTESLLAANGSLLDAIGAGDFATYNKLCSSDITCIEPETLGTIITGTNFHEHYFNMPSPSAPPAKTTHLLNVVAKCCSAGKMGVVTYNRLVQSGGECSLSQETRVWEQEAGEWKQIHFHKSMVE
jgi:hypothetical protein